MIILSKIVFFCVKRINMGEYIATIKVELYIWYDVPSTTYFNISKTNNELLSDVLSRFLYETIKVDNIDNYLFYIYDYCNHANIVNGDGYVYPVTLN